MRLLIKSKPGITIAQLKTTAKRFGGKHNKRISGIDVDVFDFDATNINKGSLVSALAGHSHVQFVEEDQLVPESLVTNDPYFSSQWHLSKIGAPTAWDTAQGNGITIAILDSGIDTAHPDFAGRLVAGYNFVDNNTNIEDVRGHGTKVAGSAAAALNNGIGVAGVAGMAKIMPVRVSDSTGYVYWSNMAAGLTWAADHGARVANMSFNGVAGSSTVLSAAKYMKDHGGLVFVSAGNDNIDPGYADTSSMIIVSATDSSDAKASFSSFGAQVDLSAPGVSIFTTSWGQTYASVSGTSFSAPITAGVAALVMSANPALTNTQVENILFSTAVELGTAGRDIYFGYGRVDAAAAVAAAGVATPTIDTTAPAVSITTPSNSATVQGTGVSVNVTATDAVGVTKVELYVKGTLYATATASPYSFTWNSTAVADGSATLVAKAYDAAGNVGTSSTITVTVSNTVDVTAPVPVITAPANNAVMPSKGNVNVTAKATDNMRVATLSIKVDGVTKSTVNGTSLTYKLNPKSLSAGSHTISAVAVDASGNVGTTSITVTK